MVLTRVLLPALGISAGRRIAFTLSAEVRPSGSGHTDDFEYVAS